MKLLAVAFTVTVTIATVLMPVPAKASPAPSASADPTTESVRLPDPIVAASFDELPPGVRNAIITGEATVSPMVSESSLTAQRTQRSAVRGDCGWVFMWIRNPSSGTLTASWGFYDLCFRATAYQWTRDIFGPQMFHNRDRGGSTLALRREVTKRWHGQRGSTGFYDGCATLWAQGPILRSSRGTACDRHWIGR
jgi:hypothetical protein